MTDPTHLPEDLKQRLLAAGVQDEASLRAALASDAALRADYERWLVTGILQRFAMTADEQSLQALVDEVPFLLDDAMISSIRSAIAQAQQRADRVNAEALTQRLTVLLRIKEQKQLAEKQAAIAKALVAFVQAGDEEVAAAVFWQNRALLASDDAEAFLINQFEWEDSKARLHLERRRQLLRVLRMRLQA
jgi:hypothetical protein